MKKCVFLSLIAGILAFTACGDKLSPKDPESPEVENETVLKLVANPDFVFSSNGTTLSSTFPGTRAAVASFAPAGEEVPFNPGVEVNLSACTASNQYPASKLSVHVRTVNDVTVFIPANEENFSENNAYSLAVLLENTTATGVYGVTEQTYVVSGNTVKATVEFSTEGISVSVTGVNQSVIDYLWDKYKDGLTVEVWNYFKDTDIDALKNSFNAGATVSFSQDPGQYVNAFAKIPDYVDALGVSADEMPRIFSKSVDVDPSEVYYDALGDDKQFLYPYLDADFTQPLASEYWVRPARMYSDGADEFVGPSKDYLLRGHKNAYDCTVAPKNVTFTNKVVNDASIPADVETTVYVIPANYNVIYSN